MAVIFRKQQISSESFESANAWDVDGDGVLDIVSGSFWYKGPSFHRRYYIGDVPRISEYYDDFSTLRLSLDGRPGFVTGGWWGGNLRWRECPADPTQEWPEHVLADDLGNIETTRMWDIDGDGELEIVPNTPGSAFAYYKAVPGAIALERHLVSETPIGHGYGFGDVDGDGHSEFVFRNGYLKMTEGAWRHVAAFELDHWDASCPMLVVDVNRDGRADLIVGRAHSYGLDWYEQTEHGKWIKHPIDPFVAQYHDLHWVDIDGDGENELVTGKRARAHNGAEAGEGDPLGIYYFKWTGESFAKQVIDHVPVGGSGGGCGIHFMPADLRGVGRLDIVAPGKDGLFVYWNEGNGSI
ncbi:MAG: VCBS repeat-containing protein [Fimbriimonas sp.]|nr:VCBS repeat-containing protein [Fimbriimonas sp.]